MIVIAFAAVAAAASAAVAFFALVVFSVLGEDRHGQLPHQAPGLIARSVRRLTGLRVCQPGQARLTKTPFTQKASRPADPACPANSGVQAISQPPSTQTGNRRSA